MTALDSSLHPVAIVGAGISGLALAYRLERLGVFPVILDAAPRIAETWRRRHCQLRLNTHRRFSRLPGRPLPMSTGSFASRDDIVRYLEDYARALASPIEFGVHVARVDRLGDGWCLRTNAGDILARHVVIATGRERLPVLPSWPGMDGFTGKLLHAADFGDARDCHDRSVPVIGAGNSGVDVLNHLVRIETRALLLSIRSGTAIIPTWLWGVPVQRLSGVMSRLPDRWTDRLLAMTERVGFGDLRRFGLPGERRGAATRLTSAGVPPAIDDGFVAALKNGRVSVVPPVARFEHDTVVLGSQRRVRPDVVIAATGYSPGLESLVGHLHVLDARGIPCFQGAEADAAHPGLWFLGMRPRLFGNFHAACRDSGPLAQRIARAEERERPPSHSGSSGLSIDARSGAESARLNLTGMAR